MGLAERLGWRARMGHSGSGAWRRTGGPLRVRAWIEAAGAGAAERTGQVEIEASAWAVAGGARTRRGGPNLGAWSIDAGGRALQQLRAMGPGACGWSGASEGSGASA
jgi:hypothetical protein